MSFADAATRFQRGDSAGAESLLRDLLAREPNHVDALHLSAVIRHRRGDLSGAADLFEAAFKLAPQDVAIAFNRAAVLAALKRHQDCAAAATDVLRLRPGDQEALLLQGVSLSALGEHARALEVLDGVTLDRAALHTHRATGLLALQRNEEALQASHRAVSLAPSDPDARYLRGSALLALDRGAEALSDFETALAVAPGNVAARAGRASALCAVKRLEEALGEADAVLAAAPERGDYHALRGVVLSALNREEEAVAAFKRSLALRPDDGETQFALADALLAQGDFESGLPAYEARFLSRTTRAPPPCDAPLWAGEDLRGKTLLLQGEQGFGDLFQFCRFAPMLAARGARIIFQGRPQTLRLLRSLAGVDQLVSADEAHPADFRLPLASAMFALGVRADAIPAPIPYLIADPERVAHWRARLNPAKRRIGIVWSGSRLQSRQRLRSLDEAALAQLIDADESFVSLQVEAHPALAARGVQQFGDEILDFAETAALIEALDLVISIDTGVAHLAGALGKPVWIMLPFRADWRWQRERSDTPWYPQARLFRQSKPGDWAGVVARVRAALQE